MKAARINKAPTYPHGIAFSLLVSLYIHINCSPLPSNLFSRASSSPNMTESCNPASRWEPLGHEKIHNKQGDDHSERTSFSDASNGSLCSSTSDLSDDQISASPSHNPSEGPLYELSSLLVQLPIRKGLSKYYQGKSQSFTSISDATRVQDLAKQISYSKRMKTCKSYATGLDMNQQPTNLLRPCKMIAKRPSKTSPALVQQCQAICSPEQERCANAYCFVTKRNPGNKN